MNRVRNQHRQITTRGTACGAPLLALLASILVLPGATGQDHPTGTILLNALIRYSRISPPESGVRLLEEVFQRVRSTPQVALGLQTNNLKQQAQVPAQKGPTDYRLAIRPRQLGKIALAPSPSLQLMPASEPAPTSLANAFIQTGSAGGIGGSGGSGGGGGGGSGGGTLSVVAKKDAPAAAEAWYGNRQYSVANLPSTHTGMWESPVVTSKTQTSPIAGIPEFINDELSGKDVSNSVNGKNLAERDSDNAGDPVAGRSAEKEQNEFKQARKKATAAPPDLATATGRLYGALRGIDDAQHVATAQSQSVASLYGNNREETTPAKRKDSASRARTATIAMAHSVNAAGSGTERQQTARMSALDAKKSALADEEVLPAGNFSHRDRDKSLKTAWNKGEIALLPPNIVSGIPLIRLGISERQANAALVAMGNLKQQKVGKWNVVSWQKQQSKNSTALQLYIRNGLLDAMRIFDPTLIAPDFGVTLGENLSKVKSTFGEPAFILQEPGPGAGQNYIYPISQVGFQLARPAPNQQPRVVSVLIFNVK